jgi:hypothetical protein
MLNVSRPNPFNTRSFLLQTVGVFAQIQTLVNQSFRLKSSNGEPRLGSSGKSHPPQAHSVLLFSNFISDFSSFPLLFLIGSSHRNLDSCRGPITILFPWTRGNLRPFWVHCSWISEDPFQGSTVETLLTVYFGAPSMFITLWFGFDYGTNPPLGTLII